MSAEWRADEGGGFEVARRAAQLEPVVTPGAEVRVWAALQKRRARLPFKLALPMFLAGAATAALVLLVLLPRARQAGDRANVVFADGTQHSLHAGDRLPRLHELELIELPAAGRAVAAPDSDARLDRLDNGAVELSLAKGALLMHVLPRSQATPFVVHTPEFVARVVGTVLRVAVGANGRASIAVGHGAVEVTPTNGAPFIVRAGERWPADSADAPTEAELDRLGAANLEGTDGRAFAPRPIVQAIATTPSEATLYHSGWQKLKAGDPRGALTLWREQRRRYPRGLLAKETQASIIDALVALGAVEAARAEVDAYLRDYPDGLRSAEMHFVRGTLLAAADRNCRRAAPEFDLALSRPVEPWAHRARAARAACTRR